MIFFDMLIGLSGSGKSTYAEKLKDEDTVVVSSDRVRDALYGSEEYQGDPEEVFSAMRSEAVAALSIGKDVIYDATNLVRKHRVALLEYLKSRFRGEKISYECTIILSPFEDCLARNNSRMRKVPESVIYNQLKSFCVPLYEGWDKIRIVDNFIDNYKFYNEHQNLLPLFKLRDLPQLGKYHTENADVHSITAHMLAVNATGISERVKKVALFHDIGKGYCHIVDEKFNNHFYGHEHAGAYLYMTTVRNQLTERDLIRSAFLIQVHDILRTGNKIIRAFENDPIMMEDLMQLDSIDRAATWRPTTDD